MKTILKSVLVELAKGINPKTQNLLDKATGLVLTADGEEIVNTTIALISKKYPDDVVIPTHKVSDYKRPGLNIFGLMDYSHRVAFTNDKAKEGKYLIETGADLSYDEELVVPPSVYADKLNLFLKKCGLDKTCDTAVTKAIRAWSSVSYVLEEETYFVESKDVKEGEEPKLIKKTRNELMIVENATHSEKSLLEAQLLQLRPKFNTELFCEPSDKIITTNEIILWAKSVSTDNPKAE